MELNTDVSIVTMRQVEEITFNYIKCNVCKVTTITKMAMTKHKVMTHKDTETDTKGPRDNFICYET